jgi:hypothetical protein
VGIYLSPEILAHAVIFIEIGSDQVRGSGLGVCWEHLFMFRETRDDFDYGAWGPRPNKVQQVWHSKRGIFPGVTMYPDFPPAREPGIVVA